MSISVVLMTANRCGLLLDCLASLAAGSRVPDEVVVVDNQSKDNTRARLVELDPPFRLVVVDGPGGAFSEARNAAVEHATSDLILFTDDDCLADRHWVERIVSRLQDHECVGGAVLPSNELDPPRHWTPDQNWLVGLSPDSFWTSRAGADILPATANMGFRRVVWESDPFPTLGGEFTETYHRRYALSREDADWWLRQIRRGRSFAVDRRAIVWHRIPNSRYGRKAVLGRAEDDGISHWRRQRPEWEIKEAARQIVNFPVAVLGDAFCSPLTIAQAWHRHRVWVQRQLAFLEAGVSDDEPVSPQTRAMAYVSAAKDALLSEGKRLARTIAVGAHHATMTARPLPSVASPPDSLLIVSHDFLGDAILELPMLAALREAFPSTRIGLLCGEVTAGLFRDTAYYDDLLVLPNERSLPVVRAAWEHFRHLKNFSPDAIILTYLHNALPLPLFAGSSTPVISWDRDNGMTQKLWRELVSTQVRKSWKKFEIAALLDLLGPMGISTTPSRPRYEPPPRANRRADDLLRELQMRDREFAVIHLESSLRPKFWDPRRWVEVAKRLQGELGLRTAFVGSIDARGIGEKAAARVPGSVTLHGLIDAAELAALMQRARLCLGSDSGPQHVAQAVGTPTVILFGPTEEYRWGPLPPLDGESPKANIFRTVRSLPLEVPANPRDPRTDRRYLEAISVDAVWESVSELLSGGLPRLRAETRIS